MKLLWIGAFAVLFASLASLVSGGQSTSLTQRSWVQASNVIPETTLPEIQQATPLNTARLFEQ